MGKKVLALTAGISSGLFAGTLVGGMMGLESTPGLDMVDFMQLIAAVVLVFFFTYLVSFLP